MVRSPANILILCLIWFAFFVRVNQLGQESLWYDELLQVDIAQGPLDQILPQMGRHAAMPLDYVLGHGWIWLGRQEFWVRWPALTFGLLALPLTYGLARRMFNRRVALLAITLLAFSSFAIQYSREVRPYALLMVLTLLSYLGLWLAYRTGRLRYWLVALVGIIGAVLTHYFALFSLVPLGLFVGVQQLSNLKKAQFWQHTALFSLGMLFIFLVLILTGRFKPLYNVSFGLSEAVARPARLVAPAQQKPNSGSGPPMTLEFAVNEILKPLAASNPVQLILYNLFFLTAVVATIFFQRRHRQAGLLLLGWVVLPIALIYLFLLYRGTFYAIRYILHTLPAYLILVAAGVDSGVSLLDNANLNHKRFLTSPIRTGLWNYRQPLLSGLLCLGLLPLFSPDTPGVQSAYAFARHEDWRAVGQLLQAYAGPDDAVIAINAEPTMNWYYPSAAAPFGTYNRTPAVAQKIDEHPKRWFVLSSYSRGRDDPLREWLRRNEGVIIGIDRRVVLYVQQRGVSARDLLAEIKAYDLPPKALTYATLARQLKAIDDTATSKKYYEIALTLTDDPDLKQSIELQLAAYLSTPAQ